jgi:hypothetical protein
MSVPAIASARSVVSGHCDLQADPRTAKLVGAVFFFDCCYYIECLVRMRVFMFMFVFDSMRSNRKQRLRAMFLSVARIQNQQVVI